MSHSSQTFYATFIEKTTFEGFKETCNELEIFSNDD